LGGGNRKLEDRVHLGNEATLILSSSAVDGRIVAFKADAMDTRSPSNRKSRNPSGRRREEQPGLVKNN